MEQEQKPITFGKIMKVAFGGWKLLLAITAGVMVVGTLAINFGYNKLKSTYVSTFSYNKSDLNANMYADGSDFYYTEIAFKENFESVAASDAEFASINIDKMFNSGKVSLTRTVEGEKETPKYSLSVPSQYFANGSQAAKFFDKVISYPIEKDEELLDKSNYESSLIAFDSASTYEAQINYLIVHVDSLLSSYEKINKSETVGVSVSSMISNNVAQLTEIAGESNVILKNYLLTVQQKGFVKDYESEEAKSFADTKESLIAEKANNDARITELKATLSGITSTQISLDKAEEILESLSERNVAIEAEIAAIDLKVANKGNTDPAFIASKAAFESKLASTKEKLSNCTESYVKVLRKSYSSTTGVAYDNSSVVQTKGSISIPIAILLSLVAGVVVGGIVNLIVRRKEFQK